MVILQIADGYAAALSDDGTVSRIPNRNYQVGQTLICPDRKKENRFTLVAKRVAAVAAVFVLLLMGAVMVNRMPVTYISLDVNPSVEYKLNVFNQVVEVVAINEDAKTLLAGTSFMRQSADEAIKQTVELLGESNYLKAEEKNGIVISASGSVSKKQTKSVLSSVAQITEETTQSIGVAADIIAIESSMSDLKKAEKLGTTPGKMLLVNEIVAADVTTLNPETDGEQLEEVQSLLAMSVKDLVSVISEDGLTQMSQTYTGVTYIPSGWTEPVKPDVSDMPLESADSDESSEDDMSGASHSSTPGVSAGQSSTVDLPSDTSSEGESGLESSDTENPGQTSSEDPSSQETVSPQNPDVEMNPSEIPPVNPGPGTSSTEDTVSDGSEQAPPMNIDEIPPVNPGTSVGSTEDIVSDESEQAPPMDIDEIPSVVPGITVSDTEDDCADEEAENAPEDTTSAVEESTLE